LLIWPALYLHSPSLQPDSPPVYLHSPSLQPDSPPVYSPYATTESYSRTSSTQSSGSDEPLLPPAGAKSGIQVSTGVGVVAVSLQSSTTSCARSGVSVILVLDQLIAGYLHYWYYLLELHVVLAAGTSGILFHPIQLVIHGSWQLRDCQQLCN